MDSILNELLEKGFNKDSCDVHPNSIDVNCMNYKIKITSSDDKYSIHIDDSKEKISTRMYRTDVSRAVLISLINRFNFKFQ